MGGTNDDDVIQIPARTYNRRNELPFDAIVTMYEYARPALGGIQEFRYAVPDAAMNNINLDRLRDAVEFAHARWKAGDRVLIRCQAGLNRSGLVTALVLIKEGHLPLDAITLLRAKRDRDALCNQDFAEWLNDHGGQFFDPSLKASA
jgi:protein-tyrosine phosphatase